MPFGLGDDEIAEMFLQIGRRARRRTRPGTQRSCPAWQIAGRGIYLSRRRRRRRFRIVRGTCRDRRPRHLRRAARWRRIPLLFAYRRTDMPGRRGSCLSIAARCRAWRVDCSSGGPSQSRPSQRKSSSAASAAPDLMRGPSRSSIRIAIRQPACPGHRPGSQKGTRIPQVQRSGRRWGESRDGHGYSGGCDRSEAFSESIRPRSSFSLAAYACGLKSMNSNSYCS